MPQKPRHRKKQGLNKGYVAIAVVIVVVIIAAGWYVFGPAISNPASTSNASSSTSASPIYARIETSMGTIEVELFPASAPKTVANFVSLAESGFYNNLVWHRIVDSPQPFVIQTGDPNTRNGDRSTWGTGGSGTTIPLETNSSLRNDQGYIGMARGAAANSGSSQFYINLTNNPSLDGHYTLFGKVISGMDVVDAIASVQVYTNATDYRYDQPITPVYMINVTILNSP